MTSLRCNHGMPTRGSCVDCMWEDGVEPPKPERACSHAMVASHDGLCGRCDQTIEAEVDRIRYTTRDRWVHEECIG